MVLIVVGAVVIPVHAVLIAVHELFTSACFMRRGQKEKCDEVSGGEEESKRRKRRRVEEQDCELKQTILGTNTKSKMTGKGEIQNGCRRLERQSMIKCGREPRSPLLKPVTREQGTPERSPSSLPQKRQNNTTDVKNANLTRPTLSAPILFNGGHGSRVVSLLASHQDEPCSIPRRVTGFSQVGRCRWSAGFLGDLPFPPPHHSGTAPYSTQSPSSDLKTSLLRTVQMSSLTVLFKNLNRWAPRRVHVSPCVVSTVSQRRLRENTAFDVKPFRTKACTGDAALWRGCEAATSQGHAYWVIRCEVAHRTWIASTIALNH
ncbi:hypothetical protein PR048_025657 [Dryococelus australis]|uniref:Uncharacterized protein n=1 Tax=Dryococelus australis TaxID=614101 RepID=A0ABQ9GJ73_9NEOP|nr:hypothetical protein PR048_025657 [Dryococelus australis]